MMSSSTFERRVRLQCQAAGAEGVGRSYGDITSAVGFDRNYPPHLRRVIEALKKNMRQDHREGRALSSVAAVRAGTQCPGWGFLELAWELGLFRGGDPKEFIEAQWQRFCEEVRLEGVAVVA